MKNDKKALLAFATALTLTAGGFTAAAGAAAAEAPTTVAQAADGAVGAGAGTHADADADAADADAADAAPQPAPASDADRSTPDEAPAPGAGTGTSAEAPAAGSVPVSATVPAVEGEAAAPALDPAPASPVVEAPETDLVGVDAAGGAVGTRVPLAVDGAALPGALVQVTFTRDEADGVVQAPVTTTADAGGDWSVGVVLESGAWSWVADQQVVDPAGVPLSERSAPSAPRGVRLVAVTAPAPSLDGPAAGALFGAVSGVSGPVEGPAARVPVSGTGTPGAAVRFALSGTQVVDYDGSVPVEADGSWATTVWVPVGVFRVSALQQHVGADGGVRQSSAVTVGEEFTVVETAALPAPVVTSPVSGAVFDTPAPETDGYVGTVFEGTGVPGAVLLPFVGTALELEDFRALVAEGAPLPLPVESPIVIDPSGRWKIYGANLPGTYLFTVTQYDPRFSAAVFSPEAPVVEYIVRAPGAAPTIVSAASGTPLVPSAVRPAAPSALAYTGADHAGDAAIAGLALLVLGSAAALIGRRRRRA